MFAMEPAMISQCPAMGHAKVLTTDFVSLVYSAIDIGTVVMGNCIAGIIYKKWL